MSRSKAKMAILESMQGQGRYIVTRKDCLLIRNACIEFDKSKLTKKENAMVAKIIRTFNKLANQ